MANPEKSTPVRVLVLVAERTFTRDDGTTDAEKGFWCFGKFFPNGESEVVLEDDPPGSAFTFYDFDKREVVEARTPGLNVAAKLRQLEHAKGGQIITVPDGNKIRQIKTPAMLTYKVLGEIRPEKRAP